MCEGTMSQILNLADENAGHRMFISELTTKESDSIEGFEQRCCSIAGEPCTEPSHTRESSSQQARPGFVTTFLVWQATSMTLKSVPAPLAVGDM